VDVFHTLMIISLCVIPLALILRSIDLKQGGGPGIE
jgi:DHA2 family multidrug resistance protein